MSNKEPKNPYAPKESDADDDKGLRAGRTNEPELGRSADLLSAELGYTDLRLRLESFPEVMSRYITEASESVSCSPDYVGVPLLAASGAAIGRTRKLGIKADWE